jgi:hypothetical protein
MKHRFRVIAITVFACSMWASAATAGLTDIQTLSTQVFRVTGCSGQPVTGLNTCFRVTVRNNGPDHYIGDPSAAPGKSALTTDKLRVTVDIDEPTGPDGTKRGGPVFSIADSFAVNISAGSTTVLQFSSTGWVPGPGDAGPYNATATSIAQGQNIDNVPGNNTAVSMFQVFATATDIPGFGTGGAIAFLAALALAAWWLWGRRRVRNAGPA